MVIDIRELAGRDGRYLTNPKLVRDNEIEDFVLKSCSTLIDPGPYSAKFKNGVIDWQQVLVGDRSYVFIAIREETFPSSEEKFYFKVPCANPLCKGSEKDFEWGIDLGQFLKKKSKPLSLAARETFLNGNRFEGVVPNTKDARKFWFKLKIGADQKRMALLMEQRNSLSKKKQEEANRMLDSILSSIVEIDGVPRARPAMMEYLENLSFRSIDGLLPIIQEPDCGVDTTVIVRCPRCSTKRAIDLPFGRSFLLPKSSKHSEASNDVEEDDDSEIDGEATEMLDAEPEEPEAATAE